MQIPERLTEREVWTHNYPQLVCIFKKGKPLQLPAGENTPRGGNVKGSSCEALKWDAFALWRMLCSLLLDLAYALVKGNALWSTSHGSCIDPWIPAFYSPLPKIDQHGRNRVLLFIPSMRLTSRMWSSVFSLISGKTLHLRRTCLRHCTAKASSHYLG